MNIENKIIECWECGEQLDNVVHTPTIYFLDGSMETIEDILSDMTEESMKEYENDIKEEYENVDYVGFGEFCPHCLQSVN